MSNDAERCGDCGCWPDQSHEVFCPKYRGPTESAPPPENVIAPPEPVKLENLQYKRKSQSDDMWCDFPPELEFRFRPSEEQEWTEEKAPETKPTGVQTEHPEQDQT